MNFEDPDPNYSPLDPKNVFKFIDDGQFLEVVNLVQAGLACYNFRSQVATDIAVDNQFLPPENFQTPKHLKKISEWTDQKIMILSEKKSQYMIFNFCKSRIFNNRLYMNETLLEQVKATRLAGGPNF